MSTSTPRNEDAVMAELLPVFRRVFDDQKLTITLTTTAQDVPGWDSLTHMSLITSVEEHFRIKFKLGDIIKFKNVGDMCRAILKTAP
jgi:acyl carrier protein